MRSIRVQAALALLAAFAMLALAACGSSKKKSASSGNTLSVTVTEAGKKAKFDAPKSVKGGVTTVTLDNKGKAPHEVQLVKLEGGHSAQEALKIIGGNPDKVPDWIRAEGGTSQVPPGKTQKATVSLDAGHYLIADGAADGPPGYTELNVSAGAGGSLPSTDTTVTAANPGKDKYRWDLSGDLKAGQQDVTFESKGKDSIHIIAAFRLNGNASNDEIVKALGKRGKPPAFVDTKTFTGTAVLDGGKSQVVSLDLSKPGKWVLFCPIKDRDGGKEHFKEGLIKQVTIK